MRFLALLELCKMGRVNLGQGETFGDLRIDWVEWSWTKGPRAAEAWPSCPASRSTSTRDEMMRSRMRMRMGHGD